MALTQRQLETTFGRFSYREDAHRRGAIVIDPTWVARNIVRIRTPHGHFSCHRLVARQMHAFIKEACGRGLITDIGGIWVPRHVLWDPTRPLSGHAFGCDIDINVDDGRDGPGGKLNYGDNSYQPRELVEIATRWGFEWGGSWRRGRDGMHFSCVRVLKPAAHTESPHAPELRMGHRGTDVEDLQRRLNARGYRLRVDGIFGPKTAGALIDWQKRQGFVASGRTDPQTWESLGRGTDSGAGSSRLKPAG